MKEVLLCKYGEIVLKGANRAYFEDMLCKELRKRAKKCGEFEISRAQSTVYVEPLDEFSDMDAMLDEAKKVFGIVSIARAYVCEKSLEGISEVAREHIAPEIRGYRTFKVEAKRSDKRFPLDSMDITREIGGVLLEANPRVKVDVRNPEITVKVEIRERAAYIYAGWHKGAGGMPVGTNGKGLLLLSGGIDSPVAGYMMMKRGMIIDCLHFESFPYTSEAARDKVLTLARELTEYAGKMRVHVISLTKIQEQIRDNCNEDYFTLILRRFMMRLASMCAEANFCPVIVTGESLGQVASQTLQALCATEAEASVPVFRPCIGLDKDEIVRTSRAIGTFETSILPYEDCCTVFTPRHPKTRPEIDKIKAEEALLDREALIAEAWESRYTVTINQFE